MFGAGEGLAGAGDSRSDLPRERGDGGGCGEFVNRGWGVGFGGSFGLPAKIAGEGVEEAAAVERVPLRDLEAVFAEEDAEFDLGGRGGAVGGEFDEEGSRAARGHAA